MRAKISWRVRKKALQVIEKLRALRLTTAAELTGSDVNYSFPEEALAAPPHQ
jgi:hypothetical protein